MVGDKEEICPRLLARMLRLKPEAAHPILRNGDADRRISVEAAKMCQVVEFFVYAGQKPNGQTS